MTTSPAPEEAIRAQLLQVLTEASADLFTRKATFTDADLAEFMLAALERSGAIAAWNRRAGGEREYTREEMREACQNNYNAGRAAAGEREQQLEAQVREQEETILALQAEIRGIHDSQWNEIETAPKTNHAILVWCPERLNIHIVCWVTCAYEENHWEHFGSHGRKLTETPTHWQPLPAPPRAALAGQTEGERNG